MGVGELLRDWRARRGLSQVALATQSGVSAKHLSFVETGRSRPSREMVLHLAHHLAVPLRQRNALLLAAGYAPTYGETSLEDPGLDGVRATLHDLLRGHEPYPAIVVDRRWDVVMGNGAAALFAEGVADHLAAPPMNALRVCLHPDGLAPRIANLGEWADHVLGNLDRQVALTGDEVLADLREELSGYVAAAGIRPQAPEARPGRPAVPMHLRLHDGEYRLLAMIASFGTPLDITLAELVFESFLPADRETADALRRRWAGGASAPSH